VQVPAVQVPAVRVPVTMRVDVAMTMTAAVPSMPTHPLRGLSCWSWPWAFGVDATAEPLAPGGARVPRLSTLVWLIERIVPGPLFG
jgi:hypothetical protein